MKEVKNKSKLNYETITDYFVQKSKVKPPAGD